MTAKDRIALRRSLLRGLRLQAMDLFVPCPSYLVVWADGPRDWTGSEAEAEKAALLAAFERWANSVSLTYKGGKWV